MQTSRALIGREDDLDALRSMVAALEGPPGPVQVLVLAGEAGIGKTRLVSELLEDGEQGREAIVVRGQCIDLDRDAPPYAPVRSLLRSLLARVGREAVLEAAGPSVGALALLVPEVADQASVATADGADRLFDAVAVLLTTLSAERPLVVVVEDLHWADQASLALLRYLVRAGEAARVLLVVTVRSDELGSAGAVRGWLADLERLPSVRRRTLSRLSRRQVRQLAESLRPAPLSSSDVTRVYERSEGVPFYVEELVCSGTFDAQSEFPETLRDVLLARYATLADSTQRLVRVLSAGGDRVAHDVLDTVLAVWPGFADTELVDAAVREAVASGLVEIDGDTYAFRHALVREAVHGELLPGERVRFHTAYARALEAIAAERDVDPTALSYHWLAAHDLPAAFSAAVAAMARARAAFAFAAAARMGERALDLWDTVPDAEERAGRSREQLLAETAYIHRNAGESERALALIDEAISCSRDAEPERMSRLLRDKASFLANLGQPGSIDLLERAVGLVADRPASVVRANVLGELAARLMLAARFDEAVRIAQRAYDDAAAVESPARMSVASNIRGNSRLALGEIDLGIADLLEAGRLAERETADSARIRFWVNLSDAYNVLGRYDDALRIAEEGVLGARARGVERTSGVILLANTVAPLVATGRVEEAERALSRAMELDPPIGFSAHLIRHSLQLMVWRGRVEEAAAMLSASRAQLDLQARIDAQSRLELAAIAGEVALEGGDLPSAWREVRILFQPEHRPFPAFDLPLALVAARILGEASARGVAVSPPDAAERVLALIDDLQWWPTASAHRALAAAEIAFDDIDLWRTAASAVDAPTSPLQQRARAHARLASLEARGAGGADRAAAVTSAEAAAELAARAGMTRIASEMAALRTRLRSGSSGSADPDALTEREHDVLELLSQGASNREIAARLFISAKTVSVHVSNILRKTGAASRTEAVYLAGRRR
ncbi:helix-turn-helix transcriptional regulator [Cnuibacter physcomitrellae]|uniref:Uncharacterized protein n=1 Tax=Cnuibacter physcomitrellae TaxID=1619308 RepID=A0A1X9LMF6_9MICO|nr:LuxR family transcriptional regulator [Cnuibacter physcomitrellae]ARJ05121.1 hypothetical protein B5808_07810 [Cnuibacter physcomitrellae]GGI34995.1 helix-turn-helix transcriptional regulator [Cnuibacter physcomitrellae]